jgi:hypothetical protein
VLEQFSVMGILTNRDHPGFFDEFVPAADRVLPDRRFLERGYPGEWWSGADGVDERVIGELFGP